MAAMEAQNSTPQSEASRLAVEAVKNHEAVTAASLGYNPYETNKISSGKACNAAVSATHGHIQGGDEIPAVQPPAEATDQLEEEPLSPEFESAYESTITSNNLELVVGSFSIIRKLLVNATTKGQDADEATAAKFRRVRLENPKIKAAIVDVEGALDLMMACGFELSAEEAGESVLVYPPGEEGPAWLSTALKRMENYEKSSSNV